MREKIERKKDIKENKKKKKRKKHTFSCSIFSTVRRIDEILEVYYTRGKNFLSILTISRNGPVKSTETRQERKDKKTTLLQKNYGRERLEDYSTSVAYLGNRSRAVFQSFFATIFCSRVVFLCFHSCLVSVRFTGPSLLVVNFYRNF